MLDFNRPADDREFCSKALEAHIVEFMAKPWQISTKAMRQAKPGCEGVYTQQILGAVDMTTPDPRPLWIGFALANLVARGVVEVKIAVAPTGNSTDNGMTQWRLTENWREEFPQ